MEQVRNPPSKMHEFSSTFDTRRPMTAAVLSNQRSQSPSEPSDRFPERSFPLSSGDSNPTTQSRAANASPNQPPTSASTSTEEVLDDSQWSRLPLDHQAYLKHHQTFLTYHHYFFKHEADDFIHKTLVENALSYEPLRFAVVGFAAFHLALQNNESKIQDFLGYYNTAVNLLRKSLANGERHTDATIMAILQLATFEVRINFFVFFATYSLVVGIFGRLGECT